MILKVLRLSWKIPILEYCYFSCDTSTFVTTLLVFFSTLELEDIFLVDFFPLMIWSGSWDAHLCHAECWLPSTPPKKTSVQVEKTKEKNTKVGKCRRISENKIQDLLPCCRGGFRTRPVQREGKRRERLVLSGTVTVLPAGRWSAFRA